MGRVGTAGGLRRFKGFDALVKESRNERDRQLNKNEQRQASTQAELQTLCSEPFVRLTISVNPPTDPLTEMEEFPEMSCLSQLQQLELVSLGKLSRLPASLVCLQHLFLQQCRRLQGLSSSLGQLKTLRSLELNDTSIDTDDASFMSALTCIPSLERLYLCTSSFTWPVATAGSLSALQTLQLGDYHADHNVVNLLRASTSLTALQMQDVTTDDSELAVAVCTLTELKTLVLESVPLPTPFLPEISRLVNLSCLSLVKCTTLEQLPESIGALTNLEELNLKGTKVLELPEAISSLPLLAALHLGDCGLLQQLPSSIGRLSRLRSLHLSGCRRLQHLGPSFEGLSQLHELYLDHCGLPSNPLELCSFTALEQLTLPCARQLPTSLYQLTYKKQHLDSLRAFLGDLREGQVVCKLQKIVVLGPEMAGKSSLLDSLIGGKPSTRKAEERTVGIDIRRWFVDTEADRVVNAYDAGGQRVYQATHGIFLGDNDLLLCVSRGAQGDASGSEAQVREAADELLEWVDGAQQRVASPRLLLAFTHLDTPEEGADPGRRFRRVLGKLRQRLKENAAVLDKAMERIEATMPKIVEEELEEEMWIRSDKLAELDKLVLEGVTPVHPGMLTSLIPILDRAGCTGLDMVYCCLGNTIEDGIKRARKMLDLVDDIEAIHERMQASLRQHLPAGDPRLASVRHAQGARLRQPMVLGSVAVSSKTNAGMPYLLHSLREATKDEALFPQKPKPIAFAVLERMFREGREKVISPAEGAGLELASGQLTGWERSLAVEAKQARYDKLWPLCAQPLLWRRQLEDGVIECGMGDAEWLERALRFLHDAGSALSFPKKGGRLASVVFTQPQWIVDAIKYVVRDPVESNSELHAMDKHIEETEHCSDVIARYERMGELDHELLKSYWKLPTYQSPHPLAGERKFPDNHIQLLIDLMIGFRLLVPIHGRKPTTYLVPAMMQTCELRPAMTEPEWWRPHDSLNADRWMRRVFRATRRLPLGLWPAMQVSLSLKAADSDEHRGITPPEHASHASWLEREEGDGAATETVVVTMEELETCVEFRVLGYIKLHPPEAGSTPRTAPVDWELFKLVTSEIQGIVAERPWVLLEEYVPIVANAQLVREERAQHLDGSRAKLTVKDATGAQLAISRAEVFPVPVQLQPPGTPGTPLASSPPRSAHLQSPLGTPVPSPGRSDQALTPASPGYLGRPKPRMLMFCARKQFDTLMDTEGETAVIQEATRHYFQPPVTKHRVSFETFETGMQDVRHNEITIVHFAGHGEGYEGLFFLADEHGSEYVSVSASALAKFLGEVQDVVECVFLNGCCTDSTGRVLIEHNVKNVVCWQNQVWDEAAAHFSKAFYQKLDSVARDHGSIPDHAYLDAFEQARAGLVHWLEKSHGQSHLYSHFVPFAPVFLSQSQTLDDPLEVQPRLRTPGRHEQSDHEEVVASPPLDSQRTVHLGLALASVVPLCIIATLGSTKSQSLAVTLGVVCVTAIAWARARDKDKSVREEGFTGNTGGKLREDHAEPPDAIFVNASTRMANNDKGVHELQACECLGVKLAYHSYCFWETKKLFGKGQLDDKALVERGVQVAGKHHLQVTASFLKAVFELRNLPGEPKLQGYTDLFGSSGVIVHWVEHKRPRPDKLRLAVAKLRLSAEIREADLERFTLKGQRPDRGHVAMRDKLLACIKELERCLEEGRQPRATAQAREWFAPAVHRAGAPTSGHVTAAAWSEDPRSRFRGQLAMMQEMGFEDTQANIAVLQATGGNLHDAINRLL